MKQKFIPVFLISIVVILLLPFLFGPMPRMDDYVLSVGVAGLLIALLWLFIGLILAIGVSTRKTGQAFLLTSALLLLLSFTLCSSGGGAFA